MSIKKEISPSQSDHNNPEEIGVCPYLRWKNDETVRYGFSQISNFCHKPRKAQPIKLSHQKNVCLSGKYISCPVFQKENNIQLPHDIRGKDIPKRKNLLNLLLLIVVLFLALGIIAVLIILRSSRLLSLYTLTPLSIPKQNNTDESAILSNDRIPDLVSVFIDPFQISQEELNSLIDSRFINDSTSFSQTIYSQSNYNSYSINSNLNGKNSFSTGIPRTTLGSDNVYNPTYLVLP